MTSLVPAAPTSPPQREHFKIKSFKQHFFPSSLLRFVCALKHKVLTAVPSPAEFKPLAVLFQKRRHISTEVLGRVQEPAESGLSQLQGKIPWWLEKNENPLFLPAKAQNDFFLLSLHFHVLEAVLVTVQIPAASQNPSAEGTFPAFSFLWETDTKQSSQFAFNPYKHPRQRQIRLQERHLETTPALSYNLSHSFRGSFLQGEGARLVEMVTAAQGTSHSQRHSHQVTSHLQPDQRFLSISIHSSEAGFSTTLVWDVKQSSLAPLITPVLQLYHRHSRRQNHPSAGAEML